MFEWITSSEPGEAPDLLDRRHGVLESDNQRMTPGVRRGRASRRRYVFALGVAAAALLLCFALLAAIALSGDPLALDRAILLELRMPDDLANAVGPWWFEVAVRDLTSLGSPAAVGLIGILVLGYLLVTRAVRAALFTALAIGGALLLERGAKLLFARVRPELVPHGIETHSTSFPSGHALLGSATCLCLAALVARTARGSGPKLYVFGAAILVAQMIGASRVYLGVHWPTDVLAGWCLGSAWTALCGLSAVLLLPCAGVPRRAAAQNCDLAVSSETIKPGQADVSENRCVETPLSRRSLLHLSKSSSSSLSIGASSSGSWTSSAAGAQLEPLSHCSPRFF